ncbi:two-component system regulatory protein YycI [Paenibacillus pasadenensis]|uniref:two-component system regulatory protein YycI n=1 Tax=Paenibacillus pasadenensis TaxID=217090 RepID=UPI00203E773D|nr:two-component system regulatory protein YycI [Paenibacillus pasadenensis]MCM3747919.1 two-component system regulatory protein YycI [Paenibacillus pasadenensis]
MDWGRAKSILILAFLLLNVLLGYQLWSDIRERVQPSSNLAELSPDTLAAMKAKRIELSGSIPKETPELQDLTYRYVSTRIPPKPSAAEKNETQPAGPAGEEELGIIPLDTPVDSRIVFEREDLLKALGDIIPELDQYEVDTPGFDDRKFVLYRMVDGRPMFNVRVELFYSNQKITGYRQDRIELLPADDKQRPQSVLPASRAVRPEIIEKYVPEDASIKEIRLGYKEGQLFNSDTQVSTPSWRILLEDGSVIYLQANSGEVLTDKPQAPSVSPPGGR